MWERIYNEMKAGKKNVAFVGVGLFDGIPNSRSFVERHKLTFPNAYDGDGSVAKRYGFIGQPYTAWIDARGNVIRQGFGPTDEPAFWALLTRVMQ